jgi:hypothetical protein
MRHCVSRATCVLKPHFNRALELWKRLWNELGMNSICMRLDDAGCGLSFDVLPQHGGAGAHPGVGQ